MQVLDGELVLSASDLTGFSASAHLTQLELRAARGEIERAKRDDPMLDVLSRRGTEHELAYLEMLRAQVDTTVVEIEYPDSTRATLDDAQEQTLEAMRKGVDVIYQATFFDGRWRGHADFLFRVEVPSDLGDWSYEVADAKLARRVKAAAIVQMCAYSEQLAALQGVEPRHIHVITGDRQRHTEKLSDYSAYYRALKARYEELVLGMPDTSTYPDRVDHCDICRWRDVCVDQRTADDHLSLVAGMRRDQTRKLVGAGVCTTTELAALAPEPHVDGIGDASLERLRHQAHLQVESRGTEPPLVELLPPEAPENPDEAWLKRGFAALPAPSPGDLFFDMEGDPYALDGDRLEYLFGVIELDAHGEPRYRAFWAHDRDAERTAFEEFVDFVMARIHEYPDLHIYHYAFYEPSTLKRLMGAHGTREMEVDELLRGERFVDLYNVVRQGVRIGAGSYSLKKVEQQYMQRPTGEVMDAGGSIVAYEAWLDSHDQAKLDEIQSYNADDCRSTLLLRNWLEARRTEGEDLFGPIPRPIPGEGGAPEELAEREALSARLRTKDPAAPAYALLAELVHWHRREELPDWWAYYHRTGYERDDDFTEDRECIGGLELVRKVRDEKQSTVYEYEFDAQDHKFSVGAKPIDPASGRPAGLVVFVDDAAGIIHLKRGPGLDGVPHPHALIPAKPVPSGVLRDAVADVAAWVADHGIDAPGPHRAIRDLLLRRPPAQLTPDNGSFLAVQGPPGSGKTYHGARMIIDLIRNGKRVGITAHSHAAIGNLLHEIEAAADERGETVRALQKADEHQECDASIVTCVRSNDEVLEEIALGDAHVIAGTAWLWARPDMRGTVDVLFVDEAGQKSLADVVAVSRAAGSIVLLGDPQQLAQPSKGSHPEGAEMSALEYLLDGEETMPEGLGLFLETTYRMHPKVCAFVSEVAYDGRLHSEPGLELQSVDGRAGLMWMPVEHSGNRTASTEEALRVRELIDELVGSDWTDKLGTTRKLQLADILVVAPYNAHVRETEAAPTGRRPHRHRRQVPRPGGAGHHLLHGHQHRRRCPALDGVPLRPPPPQRRGVSSEGLVYLGLQPHAAEGALPYSEGTPPRQCVVSVPRARRPRIGG